MESTSKYFQSSCSVFHLFLYHSEILPSLTWITTIDSQLLSLLLFLPHPNHYPNLRSKQNDIPKVPLKLHHCLFNNSLRWLLHIIDFLATCRGTWQGEEIVETISKSWPEVGLMRTPQELFLA